MRAKLWRTLLALLLVALVLAMADLFVITFSVVLLILAEFCSGFSSTA